MNTVKNRVNKNNFVFLFRIFLILMFLGYFVVCPVKADVTFLPAEMNQNFAGVNFFSSPNFSPQFNNFQTYRYGSNNFTFSNNLFNSYDNYNGFTTGINYGVFNLNNSFGSFNANNIYGPNIFNTLSNQLNFSNSNKLFGMNSAQSYNLNNFSFNNNPFRISPAYEAYNLNGSFADFQRFNMSFFLTPAYGSAGQNNNDNQENTGPDIAQPTTRGKNLASLKPVTDCDDLLARLKEAAIQEIERQIDLNIEKLVNCGGCCHYWYSSGIGFGYPPLWNLPSFQSQPLQVPTWEDPYNGDDYSSSDQTNSVFEADSGFSETAYEYSTTNVQIAGVDEADFIKNDGSYIYILANGKFRIIDAWPPENADTISTVEIEGIPKKLYVSNDRALIYSSLDYLDNSKILSGYSEDDDNECTYGYNCDFTGDNRKLKITIYNISDPSNPVLIREIRFGGSYINSRRVGTSIYMVVLSPAFLSLDIEYWPELYDSCSGYYGSYGEPTLEELLIAFEQLKEKNRKIINDSIIEDWVPSIQETSYDVDGSVINESILYDCTNFYETDIPESKSFLTLVSMDIDSTDELNKVTIFGHPGAVYASPSALYISSRQQHKSGYGWFYDESYGIQEASTVHKFKLKTEPAGCEYAGSGVIKGRVLNQFSMDEYEGHLRIATTTGHLPSPDVHSTLSILKEKSGELKVVGQIDNIAPNEDIRSVRFNGSKGFIVTFKKTDPLFALNLSNPKAPVIEGELKIPGYSTYMHLLDDDHLLTIGYDDDDQESFAWFQGIMLQIFDVSEMSAPALIHKEVIGTRGSTSDAATNHLAFNYFAPKKILAIPITICEGGSGGSYGTKMTFSGLMVYDVSLETGFSEHGRVWHKEPCSNCWEYCSNWWTDSDSIVKRSIFMDDYVYSVAMDQIIINSLNNMGQDISVIDLTL